MHPHDQHGVPHIDDRAEAVADRSVTGANVSKERKVQPDPGPPVSGSRRDRLRAELLADTHTAAWRIAEAEGINGLTMAAVAREVRVSPPALYRYFEGRDGLLHSLYQQATDQLLEHVTEAAERQDPDDISAQLHAASRAVFDWSVARPAAFDLLMGSSYRAAAASGDEVPRVIALALGGLFGSRFTRLWEEGRLTYPSDSEIPDGLRAQLDTYRAEICPHLPLGVVHLMLSCWRQIYGLLCMAVYDHLGFAFKDHGDFFEEMMAHLLGLLGLRVSPGRR